MTGSSNPAVRPGSIEEALHNGRLLLARDPGMALQQAHAILRRMPGLPDALRLAGAAHRALGQQSEAGQAELAAILSGQREPLLVEAAKCLDRNDYGEASRLAAERLRRAPDDLAALTLSAESALGFGLASEAEGLLRQVIDRAPGFAPGRALLVQALRLQDKLRDALETLEPMLEAAPDDVETLGLKSRLLTEAGRHEEVAAIGETLLKLRDDDPLLWCQYGDALRFIGRKGESALAYRRALQVDPQHGLAWWSLTNLDPSAISEADIDRIRKALEDRRDQPEHAGNLHFALAALLEKRGAPAEVMEHLSAGNDLRRAAQPYDAAELTAQVDRALALTLKTSVPRRTASPARPFTPLFIVGMPRSGSTLVERILGLHSQIEPGGELSVMPHLVDDLRRRAAGRPVEEVIADLSAEALAKVGADYRKRAGQVRTSDRPYFIDKLHMNWKHLPLILRALPDARIIDVRRSAVDCCWSNYKLLFARGHPAASDLGDLGRFYRDYVRLADGLRTVADDAMLLVRYEALLDDLEGQTRAMLDFLGLAFEPACLDFHRATAPVATASSEQVRRPLNRDGVGSAAPFEPWLAPLRAALGDLAD